MFKYSNTELVGTVFSLCWRSLVGNN